MSRRIVVHENVHVHELVHVQVQVHVPVLVHVHGMAQSGKLPFAVPA